MRRVVAAVRKTPVVTEERGQTGGGGDVGQDLMQPVRGLSGVDVPVEGEAEGEFSADPLTDEPADDARDERGDERRGAPDPFVRHVPHGARAGMGPGGVLNVEGTNVCLRVLI